MTEMKNIPLYRTGKFPLEKSKEGESFTLLKVSTINKITIRKVAVNYKEYCKRFESAQLDIKKEFQHYNPQLLKVNCETQVILVKYFQI